MPGLFLFMYFLYWGPIGAAPGSGFPLGIPGYGVPIGPLQVGASGTLGPLGPPKDPSSLGPPQATPLGLLGWGSHWAAPGFRPVPTGSNSYRFLVTRNRFPVPGSIPKFPVMCLRVTVWVTSLGKYTASRTDYLLDTSAVGSLTVKYPCVGNLHAKLYKTRSGRTYFTKRKARGR